MKMKNKAMRLLLGVLLLCALTACQLAQESMSAEGNEDRLIGVYITTEYIDLFDFGSHMNEPILGSFGGEILIDNHADRYQGRLYATFVSRPPVNETEDAAEYVEYVEYVFENTAGIPFFAPTIQQEHGNYIPAIKGDGISHGLMSTQYGDDADSVTLEGTLYVVPAGQDVYYLNPVYQSADGRVYLISGGGIESSGVHGEGLVMSQTLSNSCTVNENGHSKTSNFSITIAVSFLFAPETVAVLQMDAGGELIARTEYRPDAVPDTFVPDIHTAFLVVETIKYDRVGNEKLSRDIYSDDADTFGSFYTGEDGVCIQRWTRIEWPKSMNDQATLPA